MGRGGATGSGEGLRRREDRRDLELGYLGTVNFGAKDLASGWRLGHDEILEDYRGNARHGARMFERRLARQLGAELAPENAAHDLELVDGGKLEVRCFTSKVNFAPSRSIGAGRGVKAGDLERKLELVDAFVFCDVRGFPMVDAWVVPVAAVRSWQAAGKLGKSGSMSAAKFGSLVASAPLARLASGEAGELPPRGRRPRPTALRVAISFEESMKGRYEKIGAPIDREVVNWLARIKLASIGRVHGVAHDESASCHAASAILGLLATPEMLSAAACPRPIDEVQFFQVEQVAPDGDARVLLDIGPDINLADLVARHAGAANGRAIALAFAEAIATGWVATSSPTFEAIGYLEQEPMPNEPADPYLLPPLDLAEEFANPRAAA